MAKRDQLAIPSGVEEDPNAFEILRIWLAHQGQHVSLRSGVWEDPAAWGIMLSDLAKHVANSYYENNGLDRGKTLQRIKAALDVEFKE